MLLAIDIGNSSTKFGIFDGEKLYKRFTIPTIRTNSADEIYNLIGFETGRKIDSIIVSSVVAELKNSYAELAEKKFKAKIKFADNKFESGLDIHYIPPENLGVDRLIAAFAAVKKYGKPIIVCDFGTATTIDAVSQNSEFLGGVITPGIITLSEALFLKTSRLPRVELKKPSGIFGNSTTASIQAGIFFGYLGLVDGILKKMIEKFNVKPKIVATGGFASLIAEDCQLIEIVDEILVLEGLRLIVQNIDY